MIFMPRRKQENQKENKETEPVMVPELMRQYYREKGENLSDQQILAKTKGR